MMRLRISGGGGAFAALVVVVLLTSCAVQGPAPRAELAPQRTELNPAPRWCFSGQWTGDGKELLFADVLGGQILRYDASGRYLGAVTNPGTDALEFMRPVQLVPDEPNMILVDGNNHLVMLDQDLTPVQGRHLAESKNSDAATYIGSAIEWNGSLVGLMRIGRGRESWFGYGSVNLDTGETVRIRELPDEMSLEGNRYYFGFGPLVARVNDGIYAMVFEPEPHIERILPSSHKLNAFPDGYEAPRLPIVAGPEDLSVAHQIMEQTRMPVGIYDHGDSLYVLTREPTEAGQTRWLLHEVSVAADQLVRRMKLDTTARHLVVVPGPQYWAVLEKGAVTGSPPRQDMNSLLLVSSAAITGADVVFDMDLPR